MASRNHSEWIRDGPVSTVYRELSALPSFTHAAFQTPNVIRIGSTANDYGRNIKQKNVRTHVVTPDGIITSIPTDSGDIVKWTISPSRKRVATLREVQNDTSGGGKKKVVEIWEEDRPLISFDASKSHGAFYGDEILSALSFSPSENAIIYVAEINPEYEKTGRLTKYQYIPPLGEGYPGKKHPGVFLFSWNPDDPSAQPKVRLLQPLEQPPQPTIFTQAIFATDHQIFVVGYEYTQDYRLLGPKFCGNRLASIWEFTLPEEDNEGETLQCPAFKRTEPSLSVRSPRVYSSGGKPRSLVWVSNPVGGPHASCSTVHQYNFEAESWSENVIVDCITDPQPDDFPGLYLTSLPSEPFAVHGNEVFLLTGSIWGARTAILSISLQTGNVVRLTPPEDIDFYSWSILTTNGHDQIVAVKSSPTSPPELVIGKLTGSSDVQWRQLWQPRLAEPLQLKLDSLKTSIVSIPHRQPVETIVVRSKTSSPQPCITVPHGGPHSGLTTTFSALHATLALEGYTISMPLYTGSLGYGDSFVRKLLGKIGSLDVEDCIETVKHLSELGLTELGPGKQFISGGSHGGFLTGHLIGQYPDVFSAAVLRNPVISLGEVSTSDIPDWYYEESGIEFAAETLMTPEIYSKLYQMSPIAHVDNVKCPVLLCMGEVDLRVAPTQALTYFHALKGRKKDVTMLCFKEDAHGLESVEASSICADAILALLSKYRK